MLTQFKGNKKGWPVYITIGNIPSHIHRQQNQHALKLLGYLPHPNFLGYAQDVRSAKHQNFFHACMKELLKPLIKLEDKGKEMKLADGCICKVIPLIVAYITDFPEQTMTACTMESGCIICKVPYKRRGECIPQVELDRMMRHAGSTFTTLLEEYVNPGTSPTFKIELLRPVYPPFWSKLQKMNVHEWFAPNLLHQVHKGIFKDHLFKWIVKIIGEKEIDAQLKLIPDHPALVKQFLSEITHLKQWTVNGEVLC